MMWLTRPLYFRKIIHSWRLRLLIPKVIWLKICYTMQKVKKKKKTLLHFMVKNAENKQKNDYFTMYKLKSGLCSLRDAVYTSTVHSRKCIMTERLTSLLISCFFSRQYFYIWLTLNWPASTSCVLWLKACATTARLTSHLQLWFVQSLVPGHWAILFMGSFSCIMNIHIY